ncbi:pantetheinase-like [Watersipora subatra]|uniref:pantetheinase-like n=1 Tax=Watersipora subatra TaxID=2589382 RepID=UPI00355BDC3C
MMAALLILLLTLTAFCSASDKGYYTAAVYEHALKEKTARSFVSRKEALDMMNSNLDILEYQAIIAKGKQADIFVFPEYGISGELFGLLDLDSYLEQIPQPDGMYCPCSKDYVQKGEEVLHRLSCIASNLSIYVAANMGDKVRCRDHDPDCPLFGYYHYNTEVVFDRNGCLVAKYHKQHLFQHERLLWDEPKEVEFSFFDTEFGRFGLMICFDSVYKSPGTVLVETFNVTNIIFSTLWTNVYPYYVSVAYHSGWARTMGVNLLSSNIHNIPEQVVGSGIYGPQAILNYTFNVTTDEGVLVIAQVPINNETKEEIIVSQVSKESQPTAVSDSKSFHSHIFGDDFLFTPLESNSGNITLCNGNICCHLHYAREGNTQIYALGIFDGTHYLQGKYYLEVCLLTTCSKDGKVCGTLPGNPAESFLFYNLTSLMNTIYTYPEVVSGDRFFSDWQFTNKGYVKTIQGSNQNVSSVVLLEE